ncbi:hypothetical protein D7I39_13820 [Allopusillimonas ginsengisoli]|nr:hypothetical protein D7I39_13820 [Allopusillimonas ginsengisoli]
MYDHVIWPARFDPKTSAIYALNDIDVTEYVPKQRLAWARTVDSDATGSADGSLNSHTIGTEQHEDRT